VGDVRKRRVKKVNKVEKNDRTEQNKTKRVCGYIDMIRAKAVDAVLLVVENEWTVEYVGEGSDVQKKNEETKIQRWQQRQASLGVVWYGTGTTD